ncbi:TPA: hypothetical protein ACY3HR_005536 [Citrobacter freundii]
MSEKEKKSTQKQNKGTDLVLLYEQNVGPVPGGRSKSKEKGKNEKS